MLFIVAWVLIVLSRCFSVIWLSGMVEGSRVLMRIVRMRRPAIEVMRERAKRVEFCIIF